VIGTPAPTAPACASEKCSPASAATSRSEASSWRYTLGVLGEAIHAAAAGDPCPAGQDREKITRLAESRDLEHRLGVNGFFVALAGATANSPCRRERMAADS